MMMTSTRGARKNSERHSNLLQSQETVFAFRCAADDPLMARETSQKGRPWQTNSVKMSVTLITCSDIFPDFCRV